MLAGLLKCAPGTQHLLAANGIKSVLKVLGGIA